MNIDTDKTQLFTQCDHHILQYMRKGVHLDTITEHELALAINSITNRRIEGRNKCNKIRSNQQSE